ncbi:MAG: SIS domain-containing protein [Clostridiales bacterium]|nr:SIS domain-containing protein [Clostridiales bacterium]
MNYTYIHNLVERLPALGVCLDQMTAAADVMVEIYQGKGKILTCGNGGSNADADRLVSQLMKGYSKKRPLGDEWKTKFSAIDPIAGEALAGGLQTPLSAISLSQHASLNTAFINDVEAGMVFAQQVLGYGSAGDLLFGFSTSGNSENVYKAAVVAKALGMKILLLSGKDGGKIKPISDVAIVVPGTDSFLIQEYHLSVYNAVCLDVEAFLFDA